MKNIRLSIGFGISDSEGRGLIGEQTEFQTRVLVQAEMFFSALPNSMLPCLKKTVELPPHRQTKNEWTKRLNLIQSTGTKSYLTSPRPTWSDCRMQVGMLSPPNHFAVPVVVTWHSCRPRWSSIVWFRQCHRDVVGQQRLEVGSAMQAFHEARYTWDKSPKCISNRIDGTIYRGNTDIWW